MTSKQIYCNILLLIFTAMFLWGCAPTKVLPLPTEVSAVSEPVVVLPADTEKSILSLVEMEQAIGKLLKTDDPQIINNATMAFIRKDRYGYGLKGMEASVWGQFAGTLEKECGVDMTRAADQGKFSGVIALAESPWALTDPVDGEAIDFVHMIAVIDVEYTAVSELPYQETYYDVLMTWGGDLETFMIDVDRYAQANPKADPKALAAFAKELIGSEKPSYFSREDLLADVDGRNIGITLNKKGILLSEALKDYYSQGVTTTDRLQLFVDSYGGEQSFEELVDGFMTYSLENQYADEKGFTEFMAKFRGMKKMMLRAIPEYSGDYGDVIPVVVGKAFVAKFEAFTK